MWDKWTRHCEEASTALERHDGPCLAPTQRRGPFTSRAIRAEGVGECISAIGPKDTFDGSAQGKSLCEDDISGGLVDGQEEGRTGVQVESEVMLKCEGYNNEGAYDVLC